MSALDVILADDDRDTRDMTTTLLTSVGMVVRGFATVEGALAAALEQPPDVIVTDLQLEAGLDGVRLAVALRANPRTRAAAIVLVTGSEPSREIVEAFDAYLRKPAPIASVLDVVKALGERRRAERTSAEPSHSSSGSSRR